jgi:hypothetical protein
VVADEKVSDVALTVESDSSCCRAVHGEKRGKMRGKDDNVEGRTKKK